MKVLVALKQVPDTAAAITLRDGAVDEASLNWITNPYDEFALEEALILRDRDPATEVHAASVGPARVQEVLRTALALGASEAVHVEAAGDLDALPTARILAALARELGANLVLAGQRGVDFDRGQTGPMVAEILDWPHVGVAITAAWSDDLASAEVEREVEGGIEKVHLELPAVVTAQKGLNEPRLPSLKGKMAAKKKSIETLTPADLGIAPEQVDALEQIGPMSHPPERPPARIIEGETVEQKVDDLLRALREEAKVL